ncbi:MAG TPA: 4-(cytidine 5'-diphospho)-2-C-methyl-D-erythritol kinase [Actinomycetota bacterium]|nr:4-(cytidine 5'-diphospho)-2-C-methyl-D-erythritol kinase [Actinomycetota bacterium]
MTEHFRTYGKINLFLRVLGLRPDGFHEVETVLHGVSLADDLWVSRSTAGNIEIDMAWDEGLFGDLPPPSENLVTKVVSRLVARGVAHDGLHVDIVKRIPIGAGMGGGSANAAGAFVVLNEMLGAGLEWDDLIELAAEVGSDVPYCIHGGTALATGRGEKLTRLVAPEDLWLVLGISHSPLATADVYRAWDHLGGPAESSSSPLVLALGSGDVDEIAPLLHNDLEAAALVLRPELGRKKKELLAAGAVAAAMSGSGPTLFGLCRNSKDAHEVAERVKSSFDKVVCVRSQDVCVERLGCSDAPAARQ